MTTTDGTIPMARSAHYRMAAQLLDDFEPADSAHEEDIPNLLRALTHAVLAVARDDEAQR